MTNLGKALRQMRQSRGLTLQDLSNKSELSVAQLSKIENGKVEPSVAALRRLAKALDVSLAVLVASVDSPLNITPVRKGEGYRFERETGSHHMVDETFLHLSRSAQMQPEIMVFSPGAKTHSVAPHTGEEFTYVLEGSILFVYAEEQEYLLDEGDFIAYSSAICHRWQNPDTSREAKILVCCTPPTL